MDVSGDSKDTTNGFWLRSMVPLPSPLLSTAISSAERLPFGTLVPVTLLSVATEEHSGFNGAYHEARSTVLCQEDTFQSSFSIAYMISVRMVYFTPRITSSPE